MPNVKRANELAILGGTPVIKTPLPVYKSIGEDERVALNRVVDSGSLSGFYGSPGPEFLGGKEVKAFEAAWSERFNVSHSVSVNSNTSGLYAALGALEVGPGDEIIVPPSTMSATVMGPLLYGAIPVFADVEKDTFCLDVASVKSLITSKTKAIIAVNLFGHPAPLNELKALCEKHGLGLIEDNAQGPLASENGLYTGTIGDIGVFSLNYHKHIHTGEGGVCVTNNDELASRLQAIRNHAENIVEHSGTSLANMVGFNYRMTEMSAAVGLAQLSKIDSEVEKRKSAAERLSAAISNLEGLSAPVVRSGCEHVYYVWAPRYDEVATGVTREVYSKALAAEGFPHFLGYVRPLYMLPAFQKRIAIGRDGWPFTLTNRSYEKGLCPNAEALYEKELICFEPCAFDLTEDTVDKLVNALQKVHVNLNALR